MCVCVSVFVYFYLGTGNATGTVVTLLTIFLSVRTSVYMDAYDQDLLLLLVVFLLLNFTFEQTIVMFRGVTNYRTFLNKRVEKHNECRCFHTGQEGPLNGLIVILQIFFNLNRQISHFHRFTHRTLTQASICPHVLLLFGFEVCHYFLQPAP